MIIASNVTKMFGKLKALNDVNIKLVSGECVALIGPNGSGKTTFIKSILGMVVPDSGFITYEDKNIARDWKYRNNIGYMPQIGRYPDNMSIGQIISMMKDIRKFDPSKYDEDLIRDFELEKLSHKRMRTLSGGTRQKVSASLAFLFDPKVLILDEPTAGLDPIASEILKQKIRKEKEKNKLIIITSHVLSELDDLVSEVMYMQDGKCVFHKKTAQLREETKEERLTKVIAHIISNS